MALTNKQIPAIHDGTGAATPVPYQIMSADGAVTLSDGVVIVTKGGVCAMTIDNPPTEGVHQLTIVSTGAHAHTLTYTAGFGGGTTSRDVATWGGAVNDSIQLVSYAGTWQTVATRNVTIA